MRPTTRTPSGDSLMTCRPVLVGSESDFHLRTVAQKLRERHISPIIFDADDLAEVGYWVSQNELVIADTAITGGGRGWLRRVAPNRWTTGHRVGSVEDVSFRARVRLITSIARNASLEWLTHVDHLQAAEGRIYQLSVASRLGIATPQTVVSGDPDTIRRLMGTNAVLKPLGGGAFINDKGEPHVVHTTLLTDDLLDSGDFKAAPFVAQERVNTRYHLRVVTMRATVRTAALDADHWPLDWRAAEKAHNSWRHHHAPQVETQALRLAAELRVGFSSQDWLIPVTGPPMFIDLNPAGQWMFLPENVAQPVTDELVNFLVGR